ncbi:unnamed protein product, partial [Musa acuminata subsp. burmannicoides]
FSNLNSAFLGDRSRICISDAPFSRVHFLRKPVECKESRIGKRPIEVPPNVTIALDGQDLKVKGPLGELSRTYPREVKVQRDESGFLKVSKAVETRRANQMHGLFSYDIPFKMYSYNFHHRSSRWRQGLIEINGSCGSMCCLVKSELLSKETTVSRRNFHQNLRELRELVAKITVYMTARMYNLIKKICDISQGNWCNPNIISGGNSQNFDRYRLAQLGNGRFRPLPLGNDRNRSLPHCNSATVLQWSN